MESFPVKWDAFFVLGHMEFFVYILQSKKDHSFYIGHTSNLHIRLEQHNNGLSRYTKRKIPWVLVYVETFTSKSEAMKREYFLKRQRNREFYERLIAKSEGD